jgi:DNA-binding transcriptional LysR family regulator
MNTSYIQCFLTVAQTGSFTEAAGVLFYSQQTVSKYIAQLEADLGATLFDRTTQPIRLTAAGRYYYVLFRSANQRLALVSEQTKRYYTELVQKISIGCSEWVNPFGRIMDAVRAFRAAHPEVQVSLRKRNNIDLLNDLVDGSIELGLFSEGHLPTHRDLVSTPLAREELCLFGPSDVVGTELPAAAKAQRVDLPYLMVPGWQRSYTEDIVLGRQELETMEPRPRTVRFLPNVDSMCAEMRFSRCIAVSDRRFGFLNALPNLGYEPLGDETFLHGCCRQFCENPLVPELIEQLKTTLAE